MKTRSADQRTMNRIGRALRKSPVLNDPARLLDVLLRCGIRLVPIVGGVRVITREDGIDRSKVLHVLGAYFADRRNLARVVALLRFATEPAANFEAA